MCENTMDYRGSKSAILLALIIFLVFAFFLLILLITIFYILCIDELPISSSNLLAFSVIPVKIYKNADLDKFQIIKEAKGKSGVYR
jgi:hypothetical protein